VQESGRGSLDALIGGTHRAPGWRVPAGWWPVRLAVPYSRARCPPPG